MHSCWTWLGEDAVVVRETLRRVLEAGLVDGSQELVLEEEVLEAGGVRSDIATPMEECQGVVCVSRTPCSGAVA